MNNTKHKMVSHTSIYMLGDILRYSVSVIMIPIYTRYLTPEDYGVVELLSMLIDFTAIIFGARAGQAVFRFYCTATSEQDKKSIIASALFLGAVFNGTGAAVVSFFSEPLSIAIFSDPSYKNFIALFAVTVFLTPLIQIPFTYIRARQQPWIFLWFSLGRLCLQLFLNIYFVVHLEMHVAGVIYSAVISGIITATLLLAYTLPKTGIRISRSSCQNLFSFSMPLKLASIATFYLTFGDRYFLNMYTSLSQVGIYALGYKFGFIFILLSWTPFEKMWDTQKYAIYKNPGAKEAYQTIFLYISSLLLFLGLGISLFTKDLLKVMSDPAFLDAYKIVPIIILAYIFQAWTKFCNLGILLSNKTMQIAYAEVIAAAVITAAYFSLIPKYGIYGAAWATVIGFVARFYWTNRKAKQLFDMELPWRKVSLASILTLFCFSLSLMIPEDILISVALRSVLVIVFVVLFFSLPILSGNEKTQLLGKIKSLKNRS